MELTMYDFEQYIHKDQNEARAEQMWDNKSQDFYERTEKKQKQLKEVLEYDNNFINNLISKELDKIEENEQISKSEIKRIMKLSEKAKKSPMMSLEDFGKKWDFN